MSKPPLADEDRSALAKRETNARIMRRMAWILILGFALIFGVIAALGFTGHAATVLSTSGQIIIAVAAGGLFLYAVVTTSRSLVPMTAMDNLRALRGRIDVHQRRWRWQILFQVFVMLPGFVFLPQAFRIFGAHQFQFMRMIICGIIAFLVFILVFLLSVGPGINGREFINDEFMSALRARTMQFAYIVTMLLLVGVLVVVLWWPNLTLTALCWALYAGFAVPALYYVIVDWRASSAGEDRDG